MAKNEKIRPILKKSKINIKKKNLVIGGYGNLGKSLRKNIFFKNFHFPKKKFFDLTNKKKMYAYLRKKNIEIIVNAAAFARMKKCEENKSKAKKINITGCRNLIDVINQTNNNIYLIHISTDGVYESTIGNYSERSKLKPYNYYGKTKLEAEKIVKKFNKFLIIRTRFFNKDKIKFNEAAIDSFSSSLERNKLSKYLSILIKKNVTGILNVGGKKISDYELYKKYKKNIKICTYKEIQKKLDFKISKDASMNCKKFENILKK